MQIRRINFLRAGALAATMLGWFCGMMAVLFAVLALWPVVVAKIPWLREWSIIGWTAGLDQEIASGLGRFMPLSFGGLVLYRWAIVAAAFLLCRRLLYQSGWCRNRIKALLLEEEQRQRTTENAFFQEAPAVSELNNAVAPQKNRMEGHNLAFLAVDVVDSTGMKAGEDRVLVAHAFREFRQYVESHLSAHNYVKAVWTPDGAMVCFQRADDAAQAAVSLLRGLPDFNHRVRTIQREFQVRCGLHAGLVYYDSQQPLEELCDHVLDVAGHLQKAARPNSIFISKTAINRMRFAHEFHPASVAVDGFEVFSWQSA